MGNISKRFFLGVDAGGTKTDALIANETGEILAMGMAEGANIHNLPLNVVFKNILSAVLKAREAMTESLQEIVFERVCMGVAGVDTDMDRMRLEDFIKREMPFAGLLNVKEIVVVNDGLIALLAGTKNKSGVCLVAGTGSNCYGMNSSGEDWIAGDWGYLIGDQGSSYVIGKEILQQVMREYDGRETPTVLTKVVLDYLKLDQIPQLINWVYESGQPQISEIAAISQICGDPRLLDCAPMEIIINKTVAELAAAFNAVVKHLKIDNQIDGFELVLSGGLFKMSNNFKEKVSDAILRITPQARIVTLEKSAAAGALEIACDSEGEIRLPKNCLQITF